RRPVGVFENHHSRSIARTNRPDDTTKADVRVRLIDWLRDAGGGAVADAVVLRAKMRTALQHLTRDLDLGVPRIEALRHGAATRIARNAAGLRRIAGLMTWPIPVVRPLPHVADHIINPIPIGRVDADGRRSLPTIDQSILMRELTLPEVGHRLAV